MSERSYHIMCRAKCLFSFYVYRHIYIYKCAFFYLQVFCHVSALLDNDLVKFPQVNNFIQNELPRATGIRCVTSPDHVTINGSFLAVSQAWHILHKVTRKGMFGLYLCNNTLNTRFVYGYIRTLHRKILKKTFVFH